MSSAVDIISRVRASGANIVLDAQGLRLVNRDKLPVEASAYIAKHRADIARALREEHRVDVEERAAVIEFDGGLTRPVAEYLTNLLMNNPPAGSNAADWSWFVGEAAKIMDHGLAWRSPQ